MSIDFGVRVGIGISAHFMNFARVFLDLQVAPEFLAGDRQTHQRVHIFGLTRTVGADNRALAAGSLVRLMIPASQYRESGD